jgi:cation transport protein ChaC
MSSADAVLPYPHYTEVGLPNGDLWVFGYGSLMWDPGFPYVEWALGLDRGGACRGIAYRVAEADVPTSLEALWNREMRRGVYHPRLLRARLPKHEVKALVFIANPLHPGYAGTLPAERTAELVANCCGDRGPNVEYLARTLKHLAELGVHDHNLLRVMDAVHQLQKRES